MKTLDELKTFYDYNLYPELNELDEARKKIIPKLIIANIIVAVIFGFIFMYMFISDTLNFFNVVLVVCFSTFGFVNSKIRSKYKNDFKEQIISKIIKFIDENLEYASQLYIDRSDFNASKLYNTWITSFDGSDYIGGNIGQTKLEFSNIYASRKSGKDRTTIFDGVFFIGGFNKSFCGETFVLTDFAENVFGQAGTFLQSMGSSRGELVKLEDPEFERYFVVYSDNQVTARYILTTNLMKRLVNFKEKTGHNILISFIDSKIYIAISGYDLSLSPKYFSSIMDFGQIVEYYENIKLVTDIVDDLNLNTRIWRS